MPLKHKTYKVLGSRWCKKMLPGFAAESVFQTAYPQFVSTKFAMVVSSNKSDLKIIPNNIFGVRQIMGDRDIFGTNRDIFGDWKAKSIPDCVCLGQDDCPCCGRVIIR